VKGSLVPSAGRNKFIVGMGLVLVTGVCWAYLFLLAAHMNSMGSPLAMPMTSAWTGRDAVLMWTMWAVMMAGMMLPSAAPMVGAYSATVHSEKTDLRGSTQLFVAGYLAVWMGFAALATAAQWALHGAALVDAMGASKTKWLGGVLLLGAAAYQFTPLKDVCLRQCRVPLGFLLNQWRQGPGGAVVMGAHHGLLCIGCCWALMAMLFVLGVMNLWWIALVAAVVILEKVVPSVALTRVFGVSLALWGVALMMGVG
jgi:predicted metal-binding membrane protein